VVEGFGNALDRGADDGRRRLAGAHAVDDHLDRITLRHLVQVLLVDCPRFVEPALTLVESTHRLHDAQRRPSDRGRRPGVRVLGRNRIAEDLVHQAQMQMPQHLEGTYLADLFHAGERRLGIALAELHPGDEERCQETVEIVLRYLFEPLDRAGQVVGTQALHGEDVIGDGFVRADLDDAPGKLRRLGHAPGPGVQQERLAGQYLVLRIAGERLRHEVCRRRQVALAVRETAGEVVADDRALGRELGPGRAGQTRQRQDQRQQRPSKHHCDDACVALVRHRLGSLVSIVSRNAQPPSDSRKPPPGEAAPHRAASHMLG
jgi:hypothetical protein